jgi:hypothetical protein
MTDTVIPRNISMYPIDWETVDQVAKDYGHQSRSAAIRHIIRDWQRLSTQFHPMPAPTPRPGAIAAE